MAWTQAQEHAMRERNRTLLVSAAAGSGKTAVLTQRIIRILTREQGDISRLLIVTFTRAAAGELRTRISDALSAELTLDPTNTHLSRQLMMLGGAHISTIDSFYLDLVRAHFQAVDFPPAFRLADESELEALRREIMDDTIDAMFASEKGFADISDIFCNIRREDSLGEALTAMVGQLNKYPEGIDILARSADEIERGGQDPLHTKFGEVWKNELERCAKAGKKLFAEALEQMECEENAAALKKRLSPLYLELSERFDTVLCHLKEENYAAVRAAVNAPITATLAGGKYPAMSEGFATLRALCADFRDHWKEKVIPLGAFSPEEVAQTAAESAAVLRLLHKTLRRFEDDYRAAKKQREVAEFSDISRAAYRLLVERDGSPTALAREISESYDAIYIDEYQDVDAMQDATFRAISRPDNRFMVGDIKQSIYRFRGAQPAVFAGYRKAFPLLEDAAPDAKEAMIFMSDCFRCDENVIDFSNTVSGFLFSHSAESIGYTPQDDLHYAKERRSVFPEDPKCRVMILNKARHDDDTESPAALESEATMIAAEIERLLREERKADGTRIRPRDIAVLMRSTSLAKPLAAALTARRIPTNDTSQQLFFENPEVLCMYSLLATIDNPYRDVYLAATLRSPFFGFTLEELVTVRGMGDAALSLYEALRTAADAADTPPLLSKKIADFLTRFGVYREKAQSLSVDKLLRYLYRDTHVLSFAGYEENESGTLLRQSNLRRLYEYARTFEAGGFKGLYQFVRYVDNIMQNGTKMPTPDGDPEAVSLITIHHSKGLQYPVCFVSGTGAAFNRDDVKPQMLSDERLGCATRLCNAGPFSRTDTFFRQAIALEITRQNKEEEMRVLYVAMTRAQERLYITGTPAGKAENLQKRAALHATPEGAFFATAASSLLEWVLTALEHKGDYERYATVTVVEEDDLAAAPETHEAEESSAESAILSEEAVAAPENDAVRDILKERLSFVYPFEHLTRLPAKLSVSRLAPTVLDVFDGDATSAVADAEDTDRLLHTFDRAPCFGKKELTAAERGTATHEFLQFCDFERTKKHGVREELSRLVSMRYLAPETEEAVRLDELEAFFNSGFFRMLERAKALHRETRFHIFLPASDFTQDPTFAEQLQNERLAVQGVIDLFFESEAGELILCDYKTDRLTAAERRDPAAAARMLAARHGEQLSYYAKALTSICGRAPDKILIYSLPLGEAVEIGTDL